MPEAIRYGIGIGGNFAPSFLQGVDILDVSSFFSMAQGFNTHTTPEVIGDEEDINSFEDIIKNSKNVNR